jgi:molybdopterin converting factor subunit 1
VPRAHLRPGPRLLLAAPSRGTPLLERSDRFGVRGSPGAATRDTARVVVRVRLFAGLRERAGRRELELDLPEGASVGDALAAVGDLCAGTRVVMAVNREYATADALLHAGDELALIPPVSGGAAANVVVAGPLSLDALAARVRDPRAGAVVTFSGVTREVAALDYEAYAEMAGPVIEEIVAAAVARHGLCAAAAQHRVGKVPLGEASVIVAASAPHRGEAFAGAREIIDEIKARAPIWKREEGTWVEGSLPGPRP